jgi:hypothetical protein
MDPEGAFSYDHLMDMRRRIEETPAMSYGKLCRWLAWMQAALYHSGIVDLEYLKNLSRGFADVSGPPVVAIAGSVRFMQRMESVRDDLAGRDVIAELPLPEETDPSDPLGQRQRLAARFMKIVARESTSALLLANFDCDGTPSYVGPSAFSEAAVAFSQDKPVYLFAGLPGGMFLEELRTFGAIPLEGDLSRLVADIARAA